MVVRDSAESLTIHAPAKLNLFLEVLGRRPDGYHEVETSLVAISRFDTLTFTEDVTEGVRLRCVRTTGGARGVEPELPTGDDNLVMRAARLIRDRTGVERGVRIQLVKRIPAEAGLGGGSSDAAATLDGLNRLWRLGLPREALAEMAAELGSDVPFFLGPTGAAIGRGRGERVEPIRLRSRLHFVVVKPPIGCSTARVYGACEVPAEPESVERHRDVLREGRPEAVVRSLHNRLRPAAESTHEKLVPLATKIGELPILGHSMSGSGSAYFAVCSSARHARHVARLVDATRTGRAVACHSL